MTRIGKHGAWLLVGGLALGVLACSLTFHEYWRDECQAVLLAEETPLVELLGALQYEGHPPLLHVLLKVVALVAPRPIALSIVGALGYATLLAGTYRWLRAFTPASARMALLCTAGLAATYTYTYELGVIARGYGYGLGFALLGAAFAKRLDPDDDLKKWIPMVLCLGASILCVLHTAVLASSIALAFAIELMRPPGDRRRRARRIVLGLGLPLLPFVGVLFYITLDPGDRGVPWVPSGFRSPETFLGELWSLLQHAFATRGWWAIEWPGGAVVTVAILVAIAYLVFLQPRAAGSLGWFLGAACACSSLMIVLCVFRFFGEYRHHTPLVLPWILCFLAVVLARPFERPTLVVAIPLAAWLGVQAWLLVGSIHRDVVQPFSHMEAVAARLPPDARLVVSHDAPASCVAYLRPDVELRAPQGSGRIFTFARWDRARAESSNIVDVIAKACTGRPSVFLMLLRKDASMKLDPRLADRLGPNLLPPIERKKGLALPSEYGELYEVACRNSN